MLHCVTGEIRVSRKIRILPCGTLPHTLKKMATARTASPGDVSTSDICRFLLITSGDDGGRSQVLSTSTDDRRLFCVQRIGRLNVRQRRVVHRR